MEKASLAWAEVKNHVKKAKDIVHDLPISEIKEATPSQVGSTTSSVVSELGRKNALKSKELAQRLRDITAIPAIANNNVKKIYGSEKGRVMNQILDQAVTPKKQTQKTVIGTSNHQEYGSQDSISQVSQSHFWGRNNCTQSGARRNRAPPSITDWVCVPTKRHPGKEKPLHHGKIRSFRNLFENSFRISFLFDPNSMGSSQSASSTIRAIKFDGSNVELFREFEQSVLMKIVNNADLDFDYKFMNLLDTLGGSPLAVVQSFTEELNFQNFVKAIEALYYTYGEPTKFRDALLRQLINEEPIDIKKPESLLKINALISKVFRTFGGESGGNQLLATSFIMEAIKMTPGTATIFNDWLDASMREKNLKVLQQWLEWKYQHSVSENLLQKSAQGFRNVKIPPIMSNVSVI